MGKFYQRSFIGGMDMLSKDTDIAPNAYKYMINARQRYGSPIAINKSIDITYNLPRGNMQGFVGVGNIWIAFVNGFAYYMPITGNAWFQVPFLSLDADVEFIYFQAVPGATQNYLRQAVVTSQTMDGVVSNSIDAAAGIIQTPLSISGTPAGLVCQDGINQPWIITYDAVNNNATARLLGTYDQWSNDPSSPNSQEYVPVGKQMMYLSPILYIVAPDGKSVYRSVSGAPLNFVVNVDTDGNKLPTESLGGAATTSFAFDFDPITALAVSTTAENTFLLGTNRTIYGISPDTTTTIFGEPTFDKEFTLATGVVNHISFSDINGDTAFVDFSGPKKFNAVSTLKFSGRNDPFSKNITQAIMDNQIAILQLAPCSWSFNNYNLFSLVTTFGNAIGVYDNINNVWVGFDITDASLGGIKMFGQADFEDISYLGAITNDSRVWQLYQNSDETETAYCQMRGILNGSYSYGTFIPDDIQTELKLTSARVVVTDNVDAGNMTFISKTDDIRQEVVVRKIDGVTCGMNYPIIPPVEMTNQRRVQNITFPIMNPIPGYKLNPIIQWNSSAAVEQVMLVTADQTVAVSTPQQEKIFTKTL